MEQECIQEKMRPNCCFGCGLDNPHGLQINSYWNGDEVVCIWSPKDYMTGPPDYLYGGTSASLIDCHSVNAAIAYANRMEGNEDKYDQNIRMVTGTMTVKYLKPVPMKPVKLTATIEKVEGRKYTVKSTLQSDNVVCVEGKVVAILLKVEKGEL